MCVRDASANRGLNTTSCRRLSTPTVSPWSEMNGVADASFGSSGRSGDPPSRKMGILGITFSADAPSEVADYKTHIEVSTAGTRAKGYPSYALNFYFECV